MVNMAYIKNAGAYLFDKLGIAPVSSQAATVNGVAVDRSGFRSCKVHGLTGAATGTPTTISVAYKVQHSDTSGGTYADYVPTNGGSTFSITAASTGGSVDVDLSQAKKFVRVVAVVSFTGGTTPAVLLSAGVLLGGAEFLPAGPVPSSVAS